MSIPTFMSLNIGVSALQAMQEAENVVGNNISNSNTSGYAQETVSLVEGAPYPPVPGSGPDIGGQFAQGVQVANVSRQVNAFYNAQDRANQSTYQMYSTESTVLHQVQSILNEPSSTSLQNSLDQFFQSWQTLSTNPTNTAARQAVLSQVQTMGQTFGTVTSQLEQLQSNLSGVISGQINQLNQDSSQVAQLNQQIIAINQSGENPNQLLDQRGKLLDEMSKLANITYTSDPSGTGAINVTIVEASGNTATLVKGATAVAYPPVGKSYQTGASNITSGAIAGNVQGYNGVSQVLGSLNGLLSTLATQVNNQQASGYTLSGSGTTHGGNLIDATADPAGNIILSLSTGMTTDGVAASGASGAPGDNSNALAMAGLQSETQAVGSAAASYTTLDGTTTSQTMSGTFDQMLSQVVTNVGINTASVQSSEATANALAQQSSQLRQSVSGVSVDQQAALMIQYQNSYNAAAKFISVFDQMLQNLISTV